MKEGEEDVQQVGEAVGGVPSGVLGAAMGGSGHAGGVEGGATEEAAAAAAAASAGVGDCNAGDKVAPAQQPGAPPGAAGVAGSEEEKTANPVVEKKGGEGEEVRGREDGGESCEGLAGFEPPLAHSGGDGRGGGGRVLCTTIAENDALMLELLGARPQRFRPLIPNLVYQYSCYANYESAPLSCLNPEVDTEEE